MEESLRQPKYIKYYEFKEAPEQFIEKVATTQLLSMIFGVIAFLLKYKFSIWLSLIFFFAHFLDQKSNVPLSKFASNFGLIMLAFALIYVFPS